jgi:hypothetical protein
MNKKMKLLAEAKILFGLVKKTAIHSVEDVANGIA